MDMTSSADTARWYDNPRLGGSPSTGGGHGGSSSHQTSGHDTTDMGAFYALDNSGHRRYAYGYAPSKLIIFLKLHSNYIIYT